MKLCAGNHNTLKTHHAVNKNATARRMLGARIG
jgi:hypothetical protein